MSAFQPADGYWQVMVCYFPVREFYRKQNANWTCPGLVPGYWVSLLSHPSPWLRGGSRRSYQVPCLHPSPATASSSIPPPALLALHPCFLASPLGSITGATAAERCQNSLRCWSAWQTVARRPCIAAGAENHATLFLGRPADPLC